MRNASFVLNQIVESMYPGGDPDAEWSSDTLDTIASILQSAGLVPSGDATLEDRDESWPPRIENSGCS